MLSLHPLHHKFSLPNILLSLNVRWLPQPFSPRSLGGARIQGGVAIRWRNLLYQPVSHFFRKLQGVGVLEYIYCSLTWWHYRRSWEIKESWQKNRQTNHVLQGTKANKLKNGGRGGGPFFVWYTVLPNSSEASLSRDLSPKFIYIKVNVRLATDSTTQPSNDTLAGLGLLI